MAKHEKQSQFVNKETTVKREASVKIQTWNKMNSQKESLTCRKEVKLAKK